MNDSGSTTTDPADQWAPTRRSLVERLRNWEDQDAWREFFNSYWKLIYAVAIKAGLTDQEAEDVVQETVLSVAKKMDEFQYDPAVCSFKGWLLRVTRLRVLDQFRKRGPKVPQKGRSREDTGSTSTLDRVLDPGALQLDLIWDEEWEKNLVDAAMERVKLRVKPDHYQIFYLSAVKGLSTGEVSRMLQVNVGQVYLVRHRIAKEVKREVERLRDKPL
jgi:RNA polymerase sigma-70 factor (ECF subfamily)